MITANLLAAKPARWQMLWRNAIRDPLELLDVLGLGHLGASLGAQAAQAFPLRVPRSWTRPVTLPPAPSSW